MTCHPSPPPVSALRESMIEDMTVRGFGAKTRHDYVVFTLPAAIADIAYQNKAVISCSRPCPKRC